LKLMFVFFLNFFSFSSMVCKTLALPLPQTHAHRHTHTRTRDCLPQPNIPFQALSGYHAVKSSTHIQSNIYNPTHTHTHTQSNVQTHSHSQLTIQKPQSSSHSAHTAALCRKRYSILSQILGFRFPLAHAGPFTLVFFFFFYTSNRTRADTDVFPSVHHVIHSHFLVFMSPENEFLKLYLNPTCWTQPRLVQKTAHSSLFKTCKRQNYSVNKSSFTGPRFTR